MNKQACLASIDNHLRRMPKDLNLVVTILDPGTANFPDTSLLAENVGELISWLRHPALQQLPNHGVDWITLEEKVTEFADALEEFREFHPSKTEEPEVIRKHLVDRIGNSADVLKGTLLPYMPFLMLQSTGSSEILNRLNEATMAAEDVYKEAQQRMMSYMSELQATVEAAREASANVGVEKFASVFEGIAKGHEKDSRRWLIAAGCIGVLALIVSGFIVWNGPTWPANNSDAETNVLPYVLAKLAFVSMLYFISFWAARNYKSHRHLAVVNRHRQNSLSTFQTFVEASTDPRTKDAVLLEATRCIFSPAVTGYLGKEPEPPANRIIEIVKSMGGGE